MALRRLRNGGRRTGCGRPRALSRPRPRRRRGLAEARKGRRGAVDSRHALRVAPHALRRRRVVRGGGLLGGAGRSHGRRDRRLGRTKPGHRRAFRRARAARLHVRSGRRDHRASRARGRAGDRGRIARRRGERKAWARVLHALRLRERRASLVRPICSRSRGSGRIRRFRLLDFHRSVHRQMGAFLFFGGRGAPARSHSRSARRRLRRFLLCAESVGSRVGPRLLDRRRRDLGRPP